MEQCINNRRSYISRRRNERNAISPQHHRFWSFEISSSRSCRSSSLILSARDGIRVLASSAFSQQSDPNKTVLALLFPIRKYQGRATKLCSLKLGQILMSAEQTLHSLDILLLSESREVIQVVERLIQHPTDTIVSRLAIRRRASHFPP